MNDGIFYNVKELDRVIFRNLSGLKTINHEHNITHTQMKILDYLLKNDVVYQKDLEEKLNLRRSTISDILKTMEKNQLITRKINLNDIRSKQIELTDKSKNFFELGKKTLAELEEKSIQGIKKEELEITINVIKKMINNINK